MSDLLYREGPRSERCKWCGYGSLVPVEPITNLKVWWCKTHGIGQHYDGDDRWWDEWVQYQCAFKAEYPVDGECVPVTVLIVEVTDDE